MTYLFANVQFLRSICLKESTIFAKEQGFLTDQRTEKKKNVPEKYLWSRKKTVQEISNAKRTGYYSICKTGFSCFCLSYSVENEKEDEIEDSMEEKSEWI